jgi:hypothetical protein
VKIGLLFWWWLEVFGEVMKIGFGVCFDVGGGWR